MFGSRVEGQNTGVLNMDHSSLLPNISQPKQRRREKGGDWLTVTTLLLQKENGGQGSSDKLRGCSRSPWYSQESPAGRLTWITLSNRLLPYSVQCPQHVTRGNLLSLKTIEIMLLLAVKIWNFYNSLFSYSEHLLFLFSKDCVKSGTVSGWDKG